MMNPDQLHDQLSALAQSHGLSRWDMGASCSKDLSVQVDRGKAHQLKGAQRSAVTVRVWNGDGRVGITSCSDLSADGLAQALSGAAEASAFGDLQDPPDLSPRSTEALEPLKRELQATRPIQEMVQTLISAEQRLLDSHPSIGTVPYNGLSQRRGERVYLNSLGARRHEERSSASLYLYARAEEAGRKPRSAGAVRLGHGTAELDVQGCIDEAAELTISHLDYAPIDTGTYTCVFSPEAFLDLIGAFSNLFNARSVLDGLSLSKRESLGDSVAVPFFSLWDDARHPANLGASAFDGSGTPTARLQGLSLQPTAAGGELLAHGDDVWFDRSHHLTLDLQQLMLLHGDLESSTALAASDGKAEHCLQGLSTSLSEVNGSRLEALLECSTV